MQERTTHLIGRLTANFPFAFFLSGGFAFCFASFSWTGAGRQLDTAPWLRDNFSSPERSTIHQVKLPMFSDRSSSIELGFPHWAREIVAPLNGFLLHWYGTSVDQRRSCTEWNVCDRLGSPGSSMSNIHSASASISPTNGHDHILTSIMILYCT